MTNLHNTNSNFYNLLYTKLSSLFNEYILNGNRVRGINLNSNYSFFSINFIKGELLRPIQGDPYDNSVYFPRLTASSRISNRTLSNREGHLNSGNPSGSNPCRWPLMRVAGRVYSSLVRPNTSSHRPASAGSYSISSTRVLT